MTIRIPVFQLNSLDERELRSGLNAELRATPFTSGLIEGTEMTIDNGYNQNNYGYYEFEILGSNLTKLLKLYVSADGTNFSVIDTWGGTNGIRQKDYLTYSANYAIDIMGVLTTTEITDEIGLSAPSIGSFNTKISYTITSGSLPLNKTNFIPSAIGNAEGVSTLKNINMNLSVNGTALELRAVKNSDGSAYDLSADNGTAFNFTIQLYP